MFLIVKQIFLRRRRRRLLFLLPVASPDSRFAALLWRAAVICSAAAALFQALALGCGQPVLAASFAVVLLLLCVRGARPNSSND